MTKYNFDVPEEERKHASEVASQLIREMEFDNGSHFPYSPAQHAALTTAVKEMLSSGWEPTQENMEEMVAGEMGEVEEKFGKTPGFQQASKILNEIFDPPFSGADKFPKI